MNLYDGQTAREAIGFGMGAMLGDVSSASSVDAVYSLECNEWNGDERLQLKLEDIRPSQA